MSNMKPYVSLVYIKYNIGDGEQIQRWETAFLSNMQWPLPNGIFSQMNTIKQKFETCEYNQNLF